MKTAYLIDGTSYFFRAFHAVGSLSRSSDGMPTGGIYGFVNSLRQIEREYRPDTMIVAFDCGEPTFRHEMDENYKSNREAPPDDLLAQLPYVKEILEASGIPLVEKPGYEADDILGTFVEQLVAKEWNVVVASGDKDLLQLVSDRVSILRQHLNKSKMYEEKDVRERYQVPPEKLIEVFGLMGDTSDNIPGVPGIGEKTAVDLIVRFGTLEGLYRNLDQVKGPKRRDSLREYREQAFLSRDLATIRRDAPVELPNGLLSRRQPDNERLLQIYRDLEFRSLARELETEQAGSSCNKSGENTPTTEYTIVRSLDELRTVAEALAQAPIFAIDTETTALNVYDADLVGISLSIREGQGWYIPICHSEGLCLGKESVRDCLHPVFSDPNVKKCGQNLKFDIEILSRHGFRLEGVADDSLIGSYLVEPDRATRKLDVLAGEHLGMRMTPIEDLIGSGKNQGSMADISIERVGAYACEDTDAALRLCGHFRPKLDELGLRRLYEEVEIPLVSVLSEMELRGVRVDPAVLIEQSLALSQEGQQLEVEIHRLAGREFNINSPKQLSEILYDELRLLKGRKKSTRADILEKLASDGHDIAVKVIEYRQRTKLQSTYLEALQNLIRPETGHVHTTYNQAVTNTGRISSSEPNLQSIPIRTPLGRRVRKAFVADEGRLLLSSDYSQIELRILADLSKDPGLLSAFQSNEDIHSRTAAEVFDVSLDDVTADMRSKAKAINFGLNYGMSPYGLAQRLGIPVTEAELYIERYFNRYPLVLEYMDRVAEQAQRDKHVKTILGRRIPTRGIDDSNRNRAENARRAAINAPIQGSAADLLKKAMVDWHRSSSKGLADMILTVHDELIFEVDAERVEEAAESVREVMENALTQDLSVATPVDISWGENWAEL